MERKQQIAVFLFAVLILISFVFLVLLDNQPRLIAASNQITPEAWNYLPHINNVGNTTPTNTLVPSPAPTNTPTPTPTNTRTSTPTNTPTATATNTPTPTLTPTTLPCGTLSGIVNTDTELTSGCYYVATANILVEENITLTIPEDVTLKFDPDVYLRVDGALIVNGTEDLPVLFTRNDWSLYWTGVQIRSQSGNTSSLRNLVIEYANPHLVPNHYHDAALEVQGAQPILDGITLQYINNNPLKLTPPRGQSVTFKNGKIMHTRGIAYIDEGAVFENNYVAENPHSSNHPAVVGAFGSDIAIKNNIFINNDAVALYFNGSHSAITPIIISGNIFEGGSNGAIKSYCSEKGICNAIIQSNHIENNSGIHGQLLKPVLFVSCGNVLEHNNFQNNDALYAVVVKTFSGCDIDGANNWWDTDKASEIDALVYDYYDDFELGEVIYQPFSTGPN